PSAREVAQARAMLAWAEEGLQRLNRLADDLVDDTRIRDGQLALRRAPRDLCALVRSAVQAQRALEPDRVISLRGHCALPPADAITPLLVDVDADRIGQVVANYLSNALKYSEADRPVEVSVAVLARAEMGAQMGAETQGGMREREASPDGA